MGHRYLVSGVQLGMMKGMVESSQCENAQTVINEILENQCVGYSQESMNHDLNEAGRVFSVHIPGYRPTVAE